MADKVYTKEEFDAEVVGLVNKKKELESKLKAANTTIKANEGIDIELLQGHSKELAKLKESNLTDAERLESEDKTRKLRQTEADQKILDLTAENAKILKNNAVSELINGLGSTKDGLLVSAKREIADRVTPKEGGGYLFDGKPMSEGAKEWREDAGQVFFNPVNSGGGGQGSGGGSVNLSEYTNPDGSLNNTKMGSLRKGTPEDKVKADTITKAHGAKSK